MKIIRILILALILVAPKFCAAQSQPIAEAVTPEIQALARGLENDPVRIFNYVHDHIEHVFYYGSKRGAQLTLLDGSGNDFDQCALLVALLRAAGYTNCGYEFSIVKIPSDSADHNDLRHILNLNTPYDWTSKYNYFWGLLMPNRGYFVLVDEADFNTVGLQHVWVTNSIGGTNYYLDPAFKINEPFSGTNLVSAMGLDSNTLMTVAGGTVTADYVKGLNEAAIRSKLSDYTTNLLAFIQSNCPNASLQDILGGTRIVPVTNGLSTSRPFPLDIQSGHPLQSWTYIPTNFMSALTISFSTATKKFYYPELQGQRLSLVFSNNNKGQLFLEDNRVLQTNTSGSVITVTVSATHPYGGWDSVNHVPVDTGTALDQSKQLPCFTANDYYNIVYAFEVGPAWLHKRQQKLNAYRSQGLADTSREIVTESLNIMGISWQLQNTMFESLLGQQAGVLPQNHDVVGRTAQESGHGYYIDMPLTTAEQLPNTGYSDADFRKKYQFFDISSYFSSAFEHGIIEELQSSNLTAASTVKMLQLANTNGQAIYLASSANWQSGATVRGKTSHYNLTGAFPDGLDSLISAGYYLLLPTNGAIAVAGTGSWTGSGYVRNNPSPANRQMGMIIGEKFNGGYTAWPGSTVNASYMAGYSIAQYDRLVSGVAIKEERFFAGDPVNMADATFRVMDTDLTVGQKEPMGLNFTRYYNPNLRLMNVSDMANGWLHSYYFNLAEVSAPEVSLGDGTPAQLAPFLVATCVALNTYSPDPNPKNWLVQALVAKWAIDQLTRNAVTISLGNDMMQFIQQPDGSYTPPAGMSWTLTKTSTYKLQERHGNTYYFDTTNRLVAVTNPSGVGMTFTYTNGNISTAKDWKGRTLTFTYSGTPSRITKVADSAGRSVSFGYSTNSDGQLDLIWASDPESKTNSFLYDTNHLIVSTKNPLGQIVVSNIYNSQGRVATQYTQGDLNKMWQIYWSGFQTISQDPAGNKQRYYYDDRTRLIAQQDALGNISQSFHDGQDHIVMTVSPLNETNQFLFDANNNLTATIDPLGFSNQFFYDGQFNLTRTVDARGNPSTFGYDAQFRLLGSTNGAGDWKTFTYNTDGTLATITDAGGTTTNGYDANGFLNSIAYPGGLGSESFANNALGDSTNHTDARGFSTAFQYNLRRQLTNTIAPTNLTAKIVYDADANVLISTDARGFSTTNTWSATKKLLATALPTGAIVTNIYDVRDRLAKSINPLQQATLFTNDAAGRLISVTDPLLRTTRYGYDANYRKVSETNAQQEVTRQQWDARGSLAQQTDAAVHTSKRGYDPVGNQILLTNRNGKVWQFQFDAANRLTNTISPLNHQTSLAFDNRGLLKTLRQATGKTTTNFFDAKGRLTTRADALASTTNYFDANNNLTAVVEKGKTNSWSYDAYNRVQSYQDADGNLIQYRFDQNGNVTNLIYPGNKIVTYFYDNLNRLTNVTDWSQRKTTLTYDLASRVTSISRPNGSLRTNSFDAAGQLTNIIEKFTNSYPIAFIRQNWNPNATLQWEFLAPLPHANSAPPRSMTYDDDNRLATVNGSNVTMDDDGNLTFGPLTNGILTSLAYDVRNRLTGTGGINCGYDPAGNRTVVTNGAAVTKFVINPNAKLSQVLMRVQNNATNYYIYGAGLLYQITETATSTNTLFYHYDNRGSTIALTDGNGQVTDRIEYSAYGLTTYRSGTNDTPFLFNGRYGVMTDGNGLLYMRARYYNPYLCRFINADPSGFAGGLNFYAYANGNPISMVDPFGLGAHESTLDVASRVCDRIMQVALFVAPEILSVGGEFAVVADTAFEGDALFAAASGSSRLSGGIEFGVSSSIRDINVIGRSAEGTTALARSPWPGNSGFIEGTVERRFLMPGETFDRYGFGGGKFVSPAGTPYEARALRAGTENLPFNTYQVVKPFEVNAGGVQPWFGQPGLGTQYELPVSVNTLLNRGIIKPAP